MQFYKTGEPSNCYVTLDMDLTKGYWREWSSFLTLRTLTCPQYFPWSVIHTFIGSSRVS